MEPGDFLSLLISLLMFAVADVAVYVAVMQSWVILAI